MKRHNFLFMTAAIAVLMLGVAMLTGCNKDDKKDNGEDLANTSWKATDPNGDYTIITFDYWGVDNGSGHMAGYVGGYNKYTSFYYTYNGSSGTITIVLGDSYSFSISGNTLSFMGVSFYKQ